MTQADLAAKLRLNRQSGAALGSGAELHQRREPGASLRCARCCLGRKTGAAEAAAEYAALGRETSGIKSLSKRPRIFGTKCNGPIMFWAPDYRPTNAAVRTASSGDEAASASPHPPRRGNTPTSWQKLETEYALWLHFQDRVPEARSACASRRAFGSGGDCSARFLGGDAQSRGVRWVCGNGQVGHH